MSNITINGTGYPSPLMNILNMDVQPGAQLSYEDAKTLWIYHPLAAKVVEKPVRLALSKPRQISIGSPVEDLLVKAFIKEWNQLDCTNHVRDLFQISRVYGVGAVVVNAPDMPTDAPIDFWKLGEVSDLYVNVLDALNLAGSVVTNQTPNAPDFQKPLKYITAAGQPYHPSKSVTVFHGTPIYLDFQSSSLSFSGRSIFLRALYPLKSFVQSMQVDDLVSLKAGLLVAKIQQPGSIINNLMEKAAGYKRQLLQEASTGNVLSIQPEENIESIDLNNTDKAMTVARDNIIANIAAASDVPAMLIKDEAFTKGFGEGTEDTKQIVQYIDGLRHEMRPAFEFFDRIVMHRAWNRNFFEALKNEYPELYSDATYEKFFFESKDAFEAKWPSLMEEPHSEVIKGEEAKLHGITEILRTLMPAVDPENRSKLIEWAENNINNIPEIFSSELRLNIDNLRDYEPPVAPMPDVKLPPPSRGT